MSNKLVIFDFDDTLFPTTEYMITKTFPIEKAIELNTQLTILFKTLWKRNYHIIIVTNAEEAWINYWKNYLPVLKDVDTYSARDHYEKENIPADDWKKYMYIHLMTSNKYIKYTYIVGVGDSDRDGEAAINLYTTLRNLNDKLYVRFIQFPQNSNSKQLINLLKILPTHPNLMTN